MPTNEERRDAAKRIRESGDSGLLMWQSIRKMLGMPDDSSIPQIRKYLADLIEPERRVCEQCGKPYYPTAKDQRYCCKQCKKDHYVSERLSREGEVPEYIAKVYGLEVEDAD